MHSRGSLASILVSVAGLVMGLWLGTAMGAEPPCQERTVQLKNLKVFSLPGGDRECTVGVVPVNSDLRYREYLFSSSGLFMVFISTEGPEVTSTGSRSFFLFPRKGSVSFEIVEGKAGAKEIEIQASNGARVRFSDETMRMTEFTGMKFTESREISLTNYGGFEFVSFTGLLLDSGWKVFGTSFADPARGSLFRDSRGEICPVSNHELFTYSNEVSFTYAADSELAAFLKTQCPALDLSGLALPQ